jgi:hypothetical protein
LTAGSGRFRLAALLLVVEIALLVWILIAK